MIPAGSRPDKGEAPNIRLHYQWPRVTLRPVYIYRPMYDNDMSGQEPDKRITKFIGRHHVMTLATSTTEEGPYCASVFYAYMPERNLFVFTSDENTRHYREMLTGGRAAAAIALETRTVGQLRGLQLTGQVLLAQGDTLSEARGAYLRRFPYAVVADLTLWVLRPDFMKFTDNRLGFGKKLFWHGN